MCFCGGTGRYCTLGQRCTEARSLAKLPSKNSLPTLLEEVCVTKAGSIPCRQIVCGSVLTIPHRCANLLLFFAYTKLPMGGPRASTTRQIEAGKRCNGCGHSLDIPPWHTGERLCTRCSPLHRVYCTFFHRDGWCVQFLEPDLKTSVCRMRNFGSPDKIREMVARTPTKLMQEDKQALEYAISTGRGGLYLDLTEAQYRKLRG